MRLVAGAYLEFDSITKRFPGVVALSDVSFNVAQGSIHALLGENGAGKSTLLQILSGVHRPDDGTISIAGRPLSFHSTAHAIAAGIVVIYQELQLVNQLTVAENLYLGHLPNHAGWIDRQALRDKSLSALALLDEAIDPNTRLGKLPIGQRQMVEIAKALVRDASIIAFDEPTSSLSARETERLFAVIRRLKADGKVILYVSHRMDEIFELCDAATVLRDGRHVETFARLDVDQNTLVERMVGRQISDVFRYRPREVGNSLLKAQNVFGPGLSDPATFDVHAGEIVGFFGLVGSGRTELMKLVYGATVRTAGVISVAGRTIPRGSPAAAIAAGLVYLPEDRKAEGIIPMRSVQENVNLSARRNFSHGSFFLSDVRERANAKSMVDRLCVRTPSLRQLARNLSGGNQQKIMLGRWLSERPKVVLLDEPTRGIDVGAKSEIYSFIFELAERGLGVAVVSSELSEVLGVCDRIQVMRQGRIVSCVPRGEATQEKLMCLALPVSNTARTA